MQKQAGLSKVPTRTLPSYRETPYFHCTNTLQVRPPARRPASPDPGCPRSENRDSSARMISSRSIASISPSQVLSLRESCNRGCRCRVTERPAQPGAKRSGMAMASCESSAGKRSAAATVDPARACRPAADPGMNVPVPRKAAQGNPAGPCCRRIRGRLPCEPAADRADCRAAASACQ